MQVYRYPAGTQASCRFTGALQVYRHPAGMQPSHIQNLSMVGASTKFLTQIPNRHGHMLDGNPWTSMVNQSAISPCLPFEFHLVGRVGGTGSHAPLAHILQIYNHPTGIQTSYSYTDIQQVYRHPAGIQTSCRHTDILQVYGHPAGTQRPTTIFVIANR